jgi:hypothetical protein
MSEALLVQLTRWKRIALAALLGLVLAVTGWVVTVTVQSRRVQEALARAQRAEQQAERARDQAERIRYASQIQMAQKEFLDAGKDKKP